MTNHARKAVTASKLSKRIYHLARRDGKSPAKARKIAKDLDAKIVNAHREYRDVEKEALIGSIRSAIIAKKAINIRRDTGLALATIAKIKKAKTKNPQTNTLTSLGVFLDMEIVLLPSGSRAKVRPMRSGGKLAGINS